MNFEEIELPSNSKFGFFIVSIFAALVLYFLIERNIQLVFVFFSITILLLLITLTKPDILAPLNKFWMRLGFLLGKVTSPVVLGVIFFGLITPVSFLMKIFGRDELNLKFEEKNTYWKKRNLEELQTDNFKNQF